MIWFRYLLFILAVAFGAWCIWQIIKAIIKWYKYKIDIMKAKLEREKRLNEKEAEIIEDAQEKKTLNDRYKDKLPLDEDLREEVLKKQ